jgi:tetratricopeptide (TPR) repeat protein
MVPWLKRHLPSSVKKNVKRLLGLTRPAEVRQKGTFGSLLNPLVTAPLLARDLEMLTAHYMALPALKARESYSRQLMQQLILNPINGSLLNTSYCRNRFGNEELFWHLLGASLFGAGQLVEAQQTFAHVAATTSTPFNHVSHGRTWFALDRLPEAIHALQHGLDRHPDDFELTMELAVLYYLTKATDKANDCLARVKHHFLTKEFDAIREQSKQLTEECSQASKGGLMVRSKETDIYDDAFVTNCWWDYWVCFHRYHRYQEGSAWLSQLIQDRVGKVLLEDRSIKKVIDFGVMCAHPNYMLATRFPDVELIGVDRQDLIKSLNEAAFPRPNLRFVAGDILEQLPILAGRGSNSVLLHARTGCLCYPAFLKALYRESARAGIKYVIMYETLSLSTHYMRFFDCDSLPAEAIGIRSIMYNHDYAAYLREAGYEVVANDRVASSMLLNQRVDLGASNLVIVAKSK